MGILSVCMIASANNAAVKISDAQAKAGESFNVTVSLENCADITSLSVKLKYDSSVIELVSGKCLVNNTIIKQVDVKNNVALFKFDSENVKVDGDIFELTFKVNDKAETGTYKISFDRIVIKQLSYYQEIDISADAKTCTVAVKGVEVVTTAAPTTVAPTTVVPTTAAPTTVAPTTVVPTTVAPTTIAPTTEPTTESKTTEPMVTTEGVATTTETETTDVIVTTTEPTTDDKIPQTGESVAITVIAGVFVLAGVAFLATKKKED